MLYVKNIYDSREKPLPGKTSGVVIVWTAHRSTIFMVVVLLFSRLWSLRTIDIISEKE